jgi:hypothetical protein
MCAASEVSRPAASAILEMRTWAVPKLPGKMKDQRLGKMSEAKMKLPNLQPLGLLAQTAPTKGAPTDPPFPVEDGPAVHPALGTTTAVGGAPPLPSEALPALPCTGVEGDLRQVPQVAAEVHAWLAARGASPCPSADR